MDPKQNPKFHNQNQKPKINHSRPPHNQGGSRNSRSQAIRASRRNHDDALQMINLYQDATNVANTSKAIDDGSRLRIIGLGGMDSGGSRNMILVEYLD